MGLKEYGSAIRYARTLAGLTQEQLCDGICEPVSLSRIETNRAGVSPETFQMLMQRTGVNCEIIPGFSSRDVFQAHMDVETAFYEIKAGLLTDAYERLKRVSGVEEYFRHPNRYQRFQIAQIMLQLGSGCCDFEFLYGWAGKLMRISFPNYREGNFPERLLTLMEIRLLLTLCEILCHIGKYDLCAVYCDKITQYLHRDSIFYKEKEYLLACTAVCKCSALLALHEDVGACCEELWQLHENCVKAHISGILPQLLSCIAMCQVEMGEREKCIQNSKSAGYALLAMKNVQASLLMYEMRENYGIEVFRVEDEKFLPSLTAYPWLDVPEYRENGKEEDGDNYPYRLGNIIHDARVQQRITLERLCVGLCSKSALSKIENGAMVPGKDLCDVLLQRLGMNGDSFYVFCSDQEFHNRELLQKCVDLCNLHTAEGKEKAEKLLDEIEAALSPNDKWNLQNCVSNRLLIMPEREKHMDDYFALVEKGLKCTLPEFDETDILRYQLSYNELSLLNQLAIGYHLERRNIKAIRLLYRLLEYYSRKNFTVQEKERTFPVTLALLYHYLYQEKRFAEIIELEEHIYDPCLIHDHDFLINILLYYSQALGETGDLLSAKRFAEYTCALLAMKGEFSVAQEFADAFSKDFGAAIYF